MLGRRESKDTGPSEKVETIIGKDVEVKGTIAASSGIRIEGKVEGEIKNEGDVIVGKDARVKASIKARHLTVAGDVEGDIELSGQLELEGSGRLRGDIRVNALIIADGAVFDGSSNMSKSPEKMERPLEDGSPPEPV